ncbi:MAG: DUF2505 domain-containing protein [Kofleriaceae bacterium]
MPTRFHFEHTFRAPDPATVFAAYFDAGHQREQDAAVAIAHRHVLEDVDGPAQRQRHSRVTPRRQLPAVLRPLVKGDLAYDETLVWTKAADRLDFDIQPHLLDGRARIVATYQLATLGPGQVRRSYDGQVTVEVRLVGARIERAIVDDLGRSLDIAARVTQAYLDRHAPAT